MFRFSIKIKTEMQSWKDRFVFLLCRTSANWKFIGTEYSYTALVVGWKWEQNKQKKKKIKLNLTCVSESFALEGNKQILRTLSPFRLGWKMFSIISAGVTYLECKSSPLNGLHIHLSARRVFSFVENNLEKNT